MELCLSLLQKLEDQHKVKFLTGYMLQHLTATLPQDELEDLRLRRIGAKVRSSKTSGMHFDNSRTGRSQVEMNLSKGEVLKLPSLHFQMPRTGRSQGEMNFSKCEVFKIPSLHLNMHRPCRSQDEMTWSEDGVLEYFWLVP